MADAAPTVRFSFIADTGAATPPVSDLSTAVAALLAVAQSTQEAVASMATAIGTLATNAAPAATAIEDIGAAGHTATEGMGELAASATEAAAGIGEVGAAVAGATAAITEDAGATSILTDAQLEYIATLKGIVVEEAAVTAETDENTVATDANTGAMGGNFGNMRIVRGELGALEGNLSAATVGIAAMALQSQALMSALLQAAPIIIAAGVAVLGFDAVAKQLTERGVDVQGFGDLVSSVMDSIAVSIGGTTKALADGSAAFDKAGQSGLEFGTNLEIPSNAAQEASQQNQNLVDVLNRLPVAFTSPISPMALLTGSALDVSSSSDKAAGSLTGLMLAARAMAQYDPSGAQKLIDQLNLIAQGSPLASQSLDSLSSQMQLGQMMTQGFVAQLSALGGVTNDVADKDLSKLGGALQTASNDIALAQSKGLDASGTMQAFGGTINAAALDAETFQDKYHIIPPTLQEMVDQVVALQQQFSPLSKAQADAAESATVLGDKYGAIVGEISQYAAGTIQAKIAATALAPAINSLIDSLLKQQATVGGLTAMQAQDLASLQAIATQYGILDTAHQKDTDAVNKAEVAYQNEENELNKYITTLTKTEAKIIETAQTKIQGVQQSSKVALNAIDAEETALRNQYDNDQITQEQYNAAMLKLSDDYKAIKDAEQLAINAALIKEANSYNQAQQDAVTSLTAVDAKILESEGYHGDLAKAATDMAAKQVAAAGQGAVVIAANGNVQQSLKNLSTDIKTTTSDVNTIAGKHTAAALAANAHADATAAVSANLQRGKQPLIDAVLALTPLGDPAGPAAKAGTNFLGIADGANKMGTALPGVPDKVQNFITMLQNMHQHGGVVVLDLSSIATTTGPMGDALSSAAGKAAGITLDLSYLNKQAAPVALSIRQIADAAPAASAGFDSIGGACKNLNSVVGPAADAINGFAGSFSNLTIAAGGFLTLVDGSVAPNETPPSPNSDLYAGGTFLGNGGPAPNTIPPGFTTNPGGGGVYQQGSSGS